MCLADARPVDPGSRSASPMAGGRNNRRISTGRRTLIHASRPCSPQGDCAAMKIADGLADASFLGDAPAGQQRHAAKKRPRCLIS